jgi:hypothetical protein
MKYSDFEKSIGSKLGEAQETVNIKELLIGLNLDNINPVRKTRLFPLWLLIPLLLIGSFASFLAMDSSNIFNLKQVSENTEIQTKSENKNAIFDNSTVVSNDNQNTSNISLNNETKSSIEKSIQSTTINTSKNSEVNSSENTLLIRKSNVNRLQEDQESHSNSPSHSIQNLKKSSLTTPEINENNSSSLSSPSSSDISGISSVELINSNIKDNGQSYYKSSATTNQNLISRSNLSLPTISNRSINISSLDNDRENIFSRMKINCPSFNQAHWRLAMIPEIGVFAPFKTLENKKSDNTQAFDERQRLEKTLEGINLGLYGMLVRDGIPFYLKAGVSYSRISERMDLEYNYTKLDTTIGIISQTVSANGDSITTIMGPIVSEIKLKGKNRQHSYIHIFDLPVSVGYNTYLGGFDVGVEIGVNINLMTRATGNLLTSRSEFTNLSLNDYYKKKIGLSYFGGLMIGRNFGSLGDFYLAPRFTYFPTDFSNDYNFISQKYVSVGINVGFVYKIK